jgi:pimeloyl-ACP methyl ester carboxylesterase
MDVVRAALGEQKVNFYGLSYGTYLGAVFTQMFPERSDRIVLDSAIDPDRYWEGLVQDWGPSDEIALDDWAVWAAARDEEFRLGATPQQVRAKVEELVRVVNRTPIVVDDFAIDDHWLPFILHSLLWNFRLNEPLAATVRELADDAGGPPTASRTPRLRAIVAALRDNENSVLAQMSAHPSIPPGTGATSRRAGPRNRCSARWRATSSRALSGLGRSNRRPWSAMRCPCSSCRRREIRELPTPTPSGCTSICRRRGWSRWKTSAST